jgi:hypothetical protein
MDATFTSGDSPWMILFKICRALGGTPYMSDSVYMLGKKILQAVQGGIGGASSFAELTGDPYDNAALAAALTAITAGGGSVLSRTDITGLTGGTATDLDSIATATLASDGTTSVLINVTALGMQLWTLQAGVDAENAAGGIVRPDDYGAGNQKIWVRIA